MNIELTQAESIMYENSFLEEQEEIQVIISSLKPVDQKIFIMRYLLDFDTEEIARQLEMTKSAIDNRLYHGRKKLKKDLGVCPLKNLFKHFNDIDIDVNEFEEADVTEFEKAQFKRDLKRQVSKTKNRKWMKGVAAVCLSLGIGTASLIGLSYTTFAHEIPIVNSIIKLFSTKDKIISGYEEFAISSIL